MRIELVLDAQEMAVWRRASVGDSYDNSLAAAA